MGSLERESGTRLLKREEVAFQLNVSRYQVRDLTYEGKLPVVHLGRCVRYDPKDVETFILNAKESSRGYNSHSVLKLRTAESSLKEGR